jgi:hypothetical protein
MSRYLQTRWRSLTRMLAILDELRRKTLKYHLLTTPYYLICPPEITEKMLWPEDQEQNK